LERVCGKCAQDRAVWRDGILGEPSNPCKRGQTDVKSMMMISYLILIGRPWDGPFIKIKVFESATQGKLNKNTRMGGYI